MKNYIKYIFLLLMTMFFVYYYNDLYHNFFVQFPEIKYSYFLLAILFSLSSLLLSILVYKYSLNLFGYDPSMAMVVKMTLIPQLGKYVPGKVISYAGILWFLKEVGFTLKKGFFFLFFIQVIVLLVSFLVSFFIAIFNSTTYLFYSMVIFLGIILFIIYAKKIKFKNEDADWHFLLSNNLLFIIILIVLQLFLAGSAYYFILLSMLDVSSDIIFQVVFANSLATISGALAFFSPGGIGIKEGVLFYFINPIVNSKDTVIVSVVLLRLVTTSLDIILALVAYVLLINTIKEKE